MKLSKIMFWGVIGLTIGYGFVKITSGQPFVFEDWFTRAFFMTTGILAGWYFKGKGDI